MEAVSYGLTRVLGFSPKEAADEINRVTGKHVTNTQVSTYVQKMKLNIGDAVRIREGYGRS